MSLLSAHHSSMASPRQAGRRSRARAGASGSGGGGLAHLFTPLARLLAPLNDPANMTAQLGVAAVLLLAEAVLCLLIIRRVPCECHGGAALPADHLAAFAQWDSQESRCCCSHSHCVLGCV
jgi:hypothetical protein